MYKLPPIPTPPATVNAPLCVPVDCVEVVIYKLFGTLPPSTVPIVAVVTILASPIYPAPSMYKVFAPIPPLITLTALPSILTILVFVPPM